MSRPEDFLFNVFIMNAAGNPTRNRSQDKQARNGTLLREVEAERQKLLKRARKVTFFPHIYVSVAYRF